jgi:hypothetical protein
MRHSRSDRKRGGAMRVGDASLGQVGVGEQEEVMGGKTYIG